MTILAIPDSFKDSISSKEIISALRRGFKNLDPSIELIGCVGSDGGEGFLEAINFQVSAERIYHESLDPIGRSIEVEYLLDRSNRTAYIELAQAAGLERLSEQERNPMFTTTAGTGLQIMHAINKGAEKIYIGLGGSSTNDGGVGLASVLGFEFTDINGDRVLPIGNNLTHIHNIEGRFVSSEVKIFAVADVRNPLLGPQGASHTFAAQKGASVGEIHHLENGLSNLHQKVKSDLHKDDSDSPGSGAAGGAGYGLRVFLDAKLVSGIEFMLQLADIESIISEKKVDLIITGEGRLDHQSMQGKLIDGVLNIARPMGVPVMAICGQLSLEEQEYRKMGLAFATTIAGPEVPVLKSMTDAAHYIEEVTPKLLQQFNPQS
ncbi:MAG: glycerate kinase [Flavobacteriaceae bacterium]|nr:glycerate kinase [Bacteroidia bacterium]NNF74817.1 glycerate kinase [Flavobacteriaceae bacterium]